MNADSKWSVPFLVAAFDAGPGAVAQGEPVGCRVVEVNPGLEWDIVPNVTSGAPKATQASWQVTQLQDVGFTTGIPATTSKSPVTYSAPGDAGPAVRVTVPSPLPSGTVIQVRATRASAS